MNFIEVNKLKIDSFLNENRPCSARIYMKTFLVENMKWHKTNCRYDDMTKNHYKLLSYIKKLDSDNISSNAINDINSLSDSLFLPIRTNINDREGLLSTKLDKYIEYKYDQWRKNANISLDSFCRYNLPYRPTLLNESGIIDASIINDIGLLFDKSQMSLTDIMIDLNCKLAEYNKKTNFTESRANLGLLKLLWVNNIGCFASADYTSLILRMNNIEAVSEFCLGFKYICGKHAYCAVFDQVDILYDPGSSSYLSSKEIDKMLNIYRVNYYCNPSSPYFIDDNLLDIPEELAHPCIEDVSRLRHDDIQEVTLDFYQILAKKVIYLACFDSEKKNKFTTWGEKISNHTVKFKNIIPGMIYFPIQIVDGVEMLVSNPFYVYYNKSLNKTEVIYILKPNMAKKGNVKISRKYPIKEAVLKKAEEMIGSMFLASNNGKCWDTLHIIKNTPQIKMQRIYLNNIKPYIFYRYLTSNGRPVNISHIEYLTLKKYGYLNTIACSNLSQLILSEYERKNTYVRLINEDSSCFLSKIEYNENVETAPSWKNEITLSLGTPQVINEILFSPSNANNGIVPSNSYTLHYWDDKWISAETINATDDYIEFKDIPNNALLWLKNHTSGTEEMLFIMKDNIQYFANDDCFPSILKQIM